MKQLGIGKHLLMDAGFGQGGAQKIYPKFCQYSAEVAQVKQAPIGQGQGPTSGAWKL